jgi:hypothetical protein
LTGRKVEAETVPKNECATAVTAIVSWMQEKIHTTP